MGSPLVSFCRSELFFVSPSSENSSSYLIIWYNLFLKFLSLEFFLLVSLYCFLTHNTESIGDPSLFWLIWTVIWKSGYVITMISSDNTCFSERCSPIFLVPCMQLDLVHPKTSTFSTRALILVRYKSGH